MSYDKSSENFLNYARKIVSQEDSPEKLEFKEYTEKLRKAYSESLTIESIEVLKNTPTPAEMMVKYDTKEEKEKFYHQSFGDLATVFLEWKYSLPENTITDRQLINMIHFYQFDKNSNVLTIAAPNLQPNLESKDVARLIEKLTDYEEQNNKKEKVLQNIKNINNDIQINTSENQDKNKLK